MNSTSCQVSANLDAARPFAVIGPRTLRHLEAIGELAAPGGPRAAARTAMAMTGKRNLRVVNRCLIYPVKMTEITGLLFETVAESHLIQPTILYDFPTDISPLSKCRKDDPSVVERFEIYIAGMELGNAFSRVRMIRRNRNAASVRASRGAAAKVPREVDMDLRPRAGAWDAANRGRRYWH